MTGVLIESNHKPENSLGRDKRQYVNLPLDSLVSPAFQSHLPVDEKSDIEFLELVENIKAYGINGPITVRKKDDKYEIVNGERRVRAARVAGRTEIPAQIEELSDEEALVRQINENLHNKGYSDAERTRLVSHIATTYKLDSQQIAKKLSRSVSWVLKYLPPEFKNARMAALGRAGGEARAETFATQRVATPETSQQFLADVKKAESKLLEEPTDRCSNPDCSKALYEYEIYTVDGKSYCKPCSILANVAFENEKKRLERLEEAKKPVSAKSFDAAEEREAGMHPHDSQFQQEVFVELANEGYKFEQNQKLPVFVTEPDGLCRDVNLLVYLDKAEVDQGNRLDKGERLREQYKKDNPAVTILGIPFKDKSNEEKVRVKGLIRKKYEFLKQNQNQGK